MENKKPFTILPNGSTISELEIENVTDDDDGNYQCLVTNSNSMGMANSILAIEETSASSPEMDIFSMGVSPDHLKIESVTDSSFSLTWTLPWKEKKSKNNYVVSYYGPIKETKSREGEAEETKVMATQENISINNMTPGVYNVKVAKIEGVDISKISSGWSKSIEVHLPTKDNLPPPIENFQIEDLTISWNFHNNVTYYLSIFDENGVEQTKKQQIMKVRASLNEWAI